MCGWVWVCTHMVRCTYSNSLPVFWDIIDLGQGRILRYKTIINEKKYKNEKTGIPIERGKNIFSVSSD